MKSLMFSLVLLLAPGAVLANCESMWLTRNMVFDRAGYCFGSNLGQAVLGNWACSGKDVSLTAEESAFVAYTKRMEAEFSCSIDTSASHLDLPLLSLWLELTDLPKRDQFESGCLGWKGPPLFLRAAHNMGAPVLGQIEQGQHVLFSHWAEDGWDFVEISDDDGPVSLGWVRITTDQTTCSGFAG